MNSSLVTVAGLLQQQRSLITLDQLEEAGIGKHQRYRLVKQEVLRRGTPRVFSLAGVEDSYERRLLAAQMTPLIPSYVSHSGSAHLWDYFYLPELGIEICLVNDCPIEIRGIRVHRTTRLHQDDIAERRGIPCTSFERTLCDCTTRLSEFQLGRVLDDGLRRKVASLERLKDCAERLESGPGRHMSKVRSLLALRDPDYNPGGSNSELDVLDIVREFDLPEPTQQFEVKVKGKTYYLDYSWPQFHSYCEWYGLPWHIGASAVTRDSERITAMSGIGWRPIIFTEVSSRRSVAEDILNTLRQGGFEG
jgi:hypothetical protein